MVSLYVLCALVGSKTLTAVQRERGGPAKFQITLERESGRRDYNQAANDYQNQTPPDCRITYLPSQIGELS